MTTATTVQSSLNFGGVPLGSFGPDITPVWDLPSFNGGIEITDAPADGLVFVNISGDTDHFSIRDIYVMEWVWEPVDPGELPPGHKGPLPKEKKLEVVNFSDGTSPVEIKQGQFLLVRTAYAAGFAFGTFTATVTIEADTWETITVGLSLFIADVNTTPSGILNIAQGQKAMLPFTILSIALSAVDVRFEMAPEQLHTGLTLTPNNFNLQPTEEKTILLEFTADKNAPLGSEEVALDQYAFTRKGFFFTANITHAQVTVNPLIPNKIFIQRRGTSINIPISVQLNNGPAVGISFSTLNLPPDVSMQGFSNQFDNDEIMNVTMLVGNAVPDEFGFIIQWQTQWGQTGSMNFLAEIIEAEEISLHTSVVTDDGIALGGSVDMILRSNGSYTFKGSMEASGFPSYDFGLQVFIKAADGIVLTAFHSGNVYGTDTPGNRNNSWEENLNSTIIKAYWLSIRNNPAIGYQLHAEMGGVLGTLWDALKLGLETLVAFMVAGPTGAGIVLGNELASAASITPPPGVVAGIAVVEGAILIFGTGIIVPAIVAGAVAGVVLEVAIKSRPIHDDEKDFARIIFGDEVLRDKFNENKVWITNLNKPGNVKFTVPGLDDMIFLNLGDEAYENPMFYTDPGSDYTQPGSMFAHELTHACQIAVNNFVPGMICNAPGTYTYHSGGDEASRLTDQQWASLSWTDFTREQQAHIVDDWYGAHCNQTIRVKVDDLWKVEIIPFASLDDLRNNLTYIDALQDPAFHFITQCRAGIF